MGIDVEMKKEYGGNDLVMAYLDRPQNVYNIFDTVREDIEDITGSEFDSAALRLYVGKEGTSLNLTRPERIREADKGGYTSTVTSYSSGMGSGCLMGSDIRIGIEFNLDSYEIEISLEDAPLETVEELYEFLSEGLENRVYGWDK